MRGGETNEKAVEFYVAQLDGKLKGYEAILSKQKYLAGDVRAWKVNMTLILFDVDAYSEGTDSGRSLPLALRCLVGKDWVRLPL